MNLNDHQTSLEEAKALFSEHPFEEEAYSDLIDFIESIEFIQNLIHSKRKKVSELDRDEYGRAKIDITNPPLFEDMDYFRQPAISYINTGKFTDLYKNGNPNSEYMKFWAEETRRCKEGYIRESDGMWLTGYNYWYLNYSPIMLTEKDGKVNKDGSVRARRVYKHPRPWDMDILYFHYLEQALDAGKHGIVLKARGRGYSFKAGAMLTRNLFLKRKSISYAFAEAEEYLTNDGILNKAWDTVSFVNSFTPFKKHFAPDKMMHKRAAYFDMTDNAYKGYLSEISGVIVNKSDKVRGKRGMLAMFEEAGSFRHLLKSWNVFRSSIEDGGYVFGQAIAFGTGGSSNQQDFEALEEMFYNGNGYKILTMRNVFDKNQQNNICGFFVPTYMNRAGCYDNNGNSDIIRALAEVIVSRLIVKYGASDARALTQEKAEHPVTPVEALLKTSNSIFPTAELKDYLTDILPKQEEFVSAHYVGDLVYSGGHDVQWRLNAELEALRTYPVKEVNTNGAVEIYEQPVKDTNGNIPKGRYVMGLDPITISETGSSLLSTFVFDLWNDVFVAEYTGRRQTANETFDIVTKLALYYKATVNYENNLKGYFAYLDHRNLTHLLMDTPQILKDQELIKVKMSWGVSAKGSPANKGVNLWARKLLADWMMGKHYYNDENGEEHQTIKLRTLRSLGLIREASQWNPDGNFDRISAAGMVMIAREEMYKYVQGTRFRDEVVSNEMLDNDDFLTMNNGNFGNIEL